MPSNNSINATEEHLKLAREYLGMLALHYILFVFLPFDDTFILYIEKACDRKHFGGCHLLGKLHYSMSKDLKSSLNGLNNEHLTKALELFDHSCKYGFGDSCSLLGTHYLLPSKCCSYFVSMIESTFFTIIVCVLDDTRRNPKKSEEYLLKACDKYNNINACYNLAVLYKNGINNCLYCILLHPLLIIAFR